MGKKLFFIKFLLISSLATELPEFYHKTDDMLNSLLSINCPSLEYLETEHTHIFKLNSQAKCKTFLLFGEHARELISPELGYNLISQICQGKSPALEYSQIILVLNANPISRRKVEEGDFCLRTNENDVDINRNWGVYWDKTNCSPGSNTCSGPYPFSEPQTTEMREYLEDFKPDLFISIHSGINGIFIPWAYDFIRLDLDEEEKLLNVMKEMEKASGVDAEYGTAEEVLEYIATGSCMDYAYGVCDVPYAYAWEIYGAKEDFASFLQEVKQKGTNHKHKDPGECFPEFNPPTKSKYLETLDKWTKALEETMKLVCS